jgi:hypothetical protein
MDNENPVLSSIGPAQAYFCCRNQVEVSLFVQS